MYGVNKIIEAAKTTQCENVLILKITVPTHNSHTQNSHIFQISHTFFGLMKNSSFNLKYQMFSDLYFTN